MSDYQLIDPKSLSFETIRKNLVDYISNLPDASKWRDFYESGAGTTQVELLAGLGAFLSWHSMGARRESYLDTCQLYTSAVGLCNILGYPVNRLAAPRIRVKFFSKATVYWERENPLFLYNNVSFSLLHSQTISYGENELELVGGEWKNVTFTSQSNDKFYNFLIVDSGIDNNDFMDTFEVFNSGVLLPVVKYSDEMLPNNVIVKTNSGGVLVIFGDGVLGSQIRVNDEIVVNYVNTQGPLGVLSINPEELTTNISCTISQVSVLVPGYNIDSLSKIAVLAPGYISSKRRMVTGPDHKYILLSYSGSLISANWQKEERDCCTILLSYLFDDEHFATFTEKDSIYDFLDNYKVVGARLSLVDPVKIGMELKVVVVVNEGVTQLNLETEIRTIVSKYVMQLGTVFHIGQITADIAQISGVRRVYLQRPVSDKVLSFEEYLKLINLQVVVTSDLEYTVSVSPDNNGYWIFAKSAKTTGTSTNKLIDSSGGFTFQNITTNSLVVNIADNLEANVVSVDSDSEITLSRDIFSSVDQNYEIYSQNDV